MDKEKHQQEIESSHRRGFGGSDAAMFAAIATRGLENLSQTHLNRIGEVMGLCKPRPHFTTAAMERGHEFEDYIAKHHLGDITIREYLAKDDTKYKNFKTFAHADFAEPIEGKFFELKWTSHPENAGGRYHWQLMWYYMLGASSVVLVLGTDGEKEDKPFIYEFFDVARFADDVETLRNGLQMLDEAISSGWQPKVSNSVNMSDCPLNISNAIGMINQYNEQIKLLEKKVEEQKQLIAEYMAENLYTSINGERDGSTIAVAYVKPTVSRTFDSKAYLKAHPVSDEERERYMVEKTRAGYVSFTAMPLKNDVQAE